MRYKVPNRFNSIENKTNKQGLRWKDNCLVWGKLKLQALIERENLAHVHGLSAPIKHCRLLKRELNGKRRWFVQLVLEGKPFQKPQYQISDGLVGLDLNVSNVAFVANERAGLLPFADNVPSFEREITAISRQMQRSQRDNNPDNYEPDLTGRKGRKTVKKKGKVKKGSLPWHKSRAYLKLAQKKRNLERCKSAYVKSQNRQLVNEILQHGKNIRTEKCQLKDGKSVMARLSLLNPLAISNPN